MARLTSRHYDVIKIVANVSVLVPHLKIAPNTSMDLCINFHAFSTKCTMVSTYYTILVHY